MDGRRYNRYRRDLKTRARSLRREPTAAERKLWFEFLAGHSEKFTRQKPLGQYIADFYCARKLLVIEVDGDSHFTDKGRSYDATRTRNFVRDGIRVLRFTNLEVTTEFEAVCTAVDAALGD